MMPEKENLNIDALKLTEESLPDAIQLLGGLREDPNQVTTARQLARKIFQFADTVGQYDIASDALLNDQLVLQHEVNAAKSDASYQQKVADMQQAADQALVYITEHHVDGLLCNAHRALGRTAEIRSDVTEALKQYSLAIQKFQPKVDDAVYNARTLELEGHIATAKIRQGEVDEGTKAAADTITKLHESAEGKALLSADPYTSKVWESGIYLHMAQAFAVKDKQQYADQIKDAIENGRGVLQLPEDQAKTTWGDKNFSIRKQEFDDLESQLAA